MKQGTDGSQIRLWRRIQRNPNEGRDDNYGWWLGVLVSLLIMGECSL